MKSEEQTNVNKLHLKANIVHFLNYSLLIINYYFYIHTFSIRTESLKSSKSSSVASLIASSSISTLTAST